MTTRSQFRFQVPVSPIGTAPSVEMLGLVDQLNTFAERLQNGGIPLWGLRFDFQRTVAPTDAPGPGQPNIVGATVGGVQKVYVYDNSSWLVVGTQV